MDTSLVSRAETELKKLDPKLGSLIDTQQLTPLTRPTGYFEALVRSIIGQQVSVAAARAIYHRFEEQTKLKPKNVIVLDETTIKTIGLSKQKSSYIRDLAQHFQNNSAVYNHLESLPDQQVIVELTEIKGIGEWTAQMFLMFTLHRPDVFAAGDGGLQRAMLNLYGWESLPPKKELEALAETWRPYRTVACLHLWHSLDNAPA